MKRYYSFYIRAWILIEMTINKTLSMMSFLYLKIILTEMCTVSRIRHCHKVCTRYSRFVYSSCICIVNCFSSISPSVFFGGWGGGLLSENYVTNKMNYYTVGFEFNSGGDF